MNDDATILSPLEQWQSFTEVFCLAAAFQGRLAYFVMSIHSVSPDFLNSMLDFDPFPYLWITMLYGIAIMIFSRPSLTVITITNRLAFAIFGSLMFCYASMDCFKWVASIYPDRPYLRTFMGFLTGRIFIIHFLAFMYHLDTRSNIPGIGVRRDSAFEQMYYQY